MNANSNVQSQSYLYFAVRGSIFKSNKEVKTLPIKNQIKRMKKNYQLTYFLLTLR